MQDIVKDIFTAVIQNPLVKGSAVLDSQYVRVGKEAVGIVWDVDCLENGSMFELGMIVATLQALLRPLGYKVTFGFAERGVTIRMKEVGA